MTVKLQLKFHPFKKYDALPQNNKCTTLFYEMLRTVSNNTFIKKFAEISWTRLIPLSSGRLFNPQQELLQQLPSLPPAKQTKMDAKVF